MDMPCRIWRARARRGGRTRYREEEGKEKRRAGKESGGHRKQREDSHASIKMFCASGTIKDWPGHISNERTLGCERVEGRNAREEMREGEKREKGRPQHNGM